MKHPRYVYPQSYVVTHVGSIWQARIHDTTTIDWVKNICGSGSRPDLAIRDWKEQYRRWQRNEPDSFRAE